MTHSNPTHLTDSAAHIPRREQHIVSHSRSVLLPAGSCTALSDYVISFSESVGCLLESEKCYRKGHVCYTEGGFGIQVSGEMQSTCFKMLQVKVRICAFRTVLVKERNQEPSQHTDSFESSEIMGMPSRFTC